MNQDMKDVRDNILRINFEEESRQPEYLLDSYLIDSHILNSFRNVRFDSENIDIRLD